MLKHRIHRPRSSQDAQIKEGSEGCRIEVREGLGEG